MSTVCYKDVLDGAWYTYSTASCLDEYKPYRFLGHYIHEKHYSQIKDVFEWCLEDFRDHGFTVHYDHIPPIHYFYADYKDFKNNNTRHKGNSMSVVSFSRMLSTAKSRQFFHDYKALREYGFSLCDVMYIIGNSRSYGVKAFTSNGIYLPRKKPDLEKTYRQAGDSVFYRNVPDNKTLLLDNHGEYIERKKTYYDFTKAIPSTFNNEKELDNLKDKLKIYIETWS